ncbi:hypothetical protein C4K14_2140 [Pseudomonas chlororaphis subsp. aureofaciens]|uniref:hypothetical protein n=1 Tax=Pseudomonas chlororaphis TaxID=587753 RepID=UPI000F57ED25|nr:hypothetical protein [Pseudomonas chlororaphis]AZD84974.1 hypothetical protein C4K14_2140 [Pseudomonas chlororaphis subsp. aureofaciens]
MATQSVVEIYDRIEEFTTLLAAAELHASGAWELEFVEDMRANFTRYGAHTHLSPAQKSKLERIAKH